MRCRLGCPPGTKEQILELVDGAVRAGAAHGWACSLLGVSDDRAHRWRRRRRDTGTVEDRPPGGVALHALRPCEVAEILAITEQWGPVDRSHRKLAHRGSYERRVWVSASTLRRTLAAHGLVLAEPPVGARNRVVAGQAACLYSLIRPSQRVVRTS